jgi:dihydroorotate dehydrogenase (fumarate)
MDLSTTYLGLRLPHPLVVGAGPLGDELDVARALEDNGAALLVLRSLYEEEITGEQMDHFTNVEAFSDFSAEAGSFAPDPLLALGPDEYLEHLRRIKQAVRMPVMDGLELHIYHAASDMSMSAADVERQVVEVVREVKRSLRIPVAVKMAPLLTAFGHFAKSLDETGVDGLVLFTRFHRVDIDVEELEVVRSLPLSDSSELPLRLRGAAALAGRIKASIGITGGVHTGLDVIKATMAGAHATQMVSALLRHGPGHLQTVRRELEEWMKEREWSSLQEMRGNMSFERIPDPAAYERANFRMALR